MADPKNPFDDPELAAAMAEHGITHQPGLAAGTMEELAPLLAAAGVDFDNLDDVDLASLNAALSHATEQHNLSLFTPVTTDHDKTLATIAEFAEALTARRTRPAEDVLESIQPDPTPERPAASHVIGVSFGLLDTWYTDVDLRNSLGEVQIPKWRGPARTTAANLITAARRGDAYASLDEIIRRHGGLFALHAGALAAAATILASASRTGATVADAAAQLFSHSGGPGPVAAYPSPAPGSAFGLPPAPTERDSELIGEFTSWFADGELPSAEMQTTLDLFAVLLQLANAESVDLADPGDIEVLVDAIFEGDDPEVIAAILGVLDEYVHFRLDGGVDLDDWNTAHDAVDEGFDDLLSDTADVPLDLISAMKKTTSFSDSEAQAAFAHTRIISAVVELLEWIGTSRPITATGGLRRADIKDVAAMIGVEAVGVATLPPPSHHDLSRDLDAPLPEPAIIHAMSMKDVPMLAAWWAALEDADVIELSATRVRPGELATGFTSDTPPPREASTRIVIGFIGQILTQDLGRFRYYLADHASAIAIQELRKITAGPGETPEAPFTNTELRLRPAALRLLGYLEKVGLIERDGEDRVVPEPLLGSVGAGLMMATDTLSDYINAQEY